MLRMFPDVLKFYPAWKDFYTSIFDSGYSISITNMYPDTKSYFFMMSIFISTILFSKNYIICIQLRIRTKINTISIISICIPSVYLTSLAMAHPIRADSNLTGGRTGGDRYRFSWWDAGEVTRECCHHSRRTGVVALWTFGAGRKPTYLKYTYSWSTQWGRTVWAPSSPVRVAVKAYVQLKFAFHMYRGS